MFKSDIELGIKAVTVNKFVTEDGLSFWDIGEARSHAISMKLNQAIDSYFREKNILR